VTIIKYLYKAANRAGHTVEGVIEAADRKAVLFALRAKALYLLELSEVAPRTAFDINIGSQKIPKKTLAVFCTQFASILKAGVPLVQALGILTEQTEHKQLHKILATVGDDLQSGKGLSESLSAHEKALPPIMIKLIEAGEMSGTLDVSLQRLALQFEKDYKLQKKIKSAMSYPIIVGVVALLVVIFLLVFIMPKFTSMFSSMDAELPAITKFMLSVSDFVVNGWMYILSFVILIYALFRLYKGSAVGRMQLDSMKLKMPVVKKAMTRILAARFARTLATLTASGVSLTQSLRIASKVVANKVAENKLLDIEEQIKRGVTLHAAISRETIFPKMMMHMVKIGEESGTLDQMLEKAADYFEDEAETSVEKLTSLLQPIMLVIVAAIVLLIILSVMLPMFSIYSSVQ
jgi:type IV pilus assembly protein PilC